MKKINLNSVKSYLSRDEMRVISGGSGASGNCSVLCNSGVTIFHAPNCSEGTQAWACSNQNGPKICSCLY